ncbi:hypothetical protein [Telmatospirillum sp.]|uniref:hypothetical protein n=1 Tax=Telmatospirillum sp. TaxID=2079197 RepID=UPI00283D9E1E|nr:hypothetical protein [Telmatospirillum sp.]MDR3436448.1 hypothetical protein [Telmatospirillum sp.]
MIYNGADGDLADKLFVGMQLDGTGRLSVVMNDDDNATVIELPQNGQANSADPKFFVDTAAGMIDARDLQTTFFSTDGLTFQWGPNGHLQMVIL